MASKAQKRARLHKQRMREQAANAKPSKNSYERMVERCVRNNRAREKRGELRADFWRDYTERFGSHEPPPEPEGPLQGSCARKSIFEDHLFKK